MNHGVNIKLRKDNGHLWIAEPSGKKIGVKDLRAGKYYLRSDNSALRFNSYRRIIEITNNETVWWEDGIITYHCSPPHFLSKCGYEATDEEVSFINRELEKFRQTSEAERR
jgi:hypothetical protein